jgi:stress response protein YsnF
MLVAARWSLLALLASFAAAACEKSAVASPPVVPEVVVQQVEVRDTPVEVVVTGQVRGGEDVEIRAVSEIPITQKRARVVEEIVVTRDVSEHVEKIADTLRRTEAEVTQLPIDPKSIRQP